MGAGFQLYTEGSSEALSLGGAISARRDLISNAWYNPSSLAGWDKMHLMLGNSFVNLSCTYRENGYHSEVEDRWRTIPHTYFVLPLTTRVTGMLSVTAPYGLTSEWQSSWKGNSLAIDTSLRCVYITSSLAYKFSDNLSLAAGISLVKSDVNIRRQTAVPGLGELRLKADDYALGYSFSFNYKFNEDWQLGFRFQSRVDSTLNGKAKYKNPGLYAVGVGLGGVPIFMPFNNDDASGDIRLPSSWNLGISTTCIRNWTFGMDIIWTEWSSYDSLVYNMDNGGVPFSSKTRKNWKDVFSVRFGAEYQLNSNWCLRTGYMWDDSPVNEATRSPELPGTDRNMLSVGIGYKRDDWGVDIGYSYVYCKKGDVGDDTTPVLDANADYTTRVQVLSLSFWYTF